MGKEVKSCVIISGAPEEDLSYYNKYINKNFIICADSGYLKCLKLGISPDLIIGDFDSAAMPEYDCEIIKLNTRKDDTDTFHCIKEAIDRGYSHITVLGAIGSRFDHSYSNVLSLVYAHNKGAECKIVSSNNVIEIIDSPVCIKRDEYRFFSLFALFETVYGLNIKGAEYELDNYTLEPFDHLTQSNAFKDDNIVNIDFKNGRIILILSND